MTYSVAAQQIPDSDLLGVARQKLSWPVKHCLYLMRESCIDGVSLHTCLGQMKLYI